MRDAEERLAEIEELNEVSGRAFKVTNDPRLTRSGAVPAPHRPRRAAPAVERAARRDEPGRATAAAAQRGRRLRRVASAAAVDEAGHHRPVAGSARDASPTSIAGFALDLEYIDRWSLLLDFKILLRTIPAVVDQEGR